MNVFRGLGHVLQYINVCRIDVRVIRKTSRSATYRTYVNSIMCYGMENSMVNCAISRTKDDMLSNIPHAMITCNHSLPPFH